MAHSRFTGKTVLITGGSRGIGAAMAERFAREGAQVAITYSSSANQANALIERLAGGCAKAIAIQADAAQRGSSAAAVRQVVSELGGLAIVVANAGILPVGAAGDFADSDFDRLFDINVHSAFETVRAAGEVLPEGGRVIVIGSVSAQTAMFPGMSLYGASKAAVTGLVRGWARDMGRRAITVNCIQPGPIDTALNPGDGPHAQLLRGISALGRYGRPEEVASLAAFLASDEAGYITGATVNIDGGLTA